MEFVERDYQEPQGRAVHAATVRAVLFALVWIVLTGGSFAYWGVAVLVIGAATVTSLLLLPPGVSTWSLSGLARFIPYFLWHSFRGGLDVSWRALHPRMPLNQDIVTYRFRLPKGPSQVVFVNAMNLQPGTLSVRFDGDRLLVHALDASPQVMEDLEALEDHVAELFGIDLDLEPFA